MLRRNYARELTAWAFLPLMLGCIQGGTMGVVLKKGFSGVDGLGDREIDQAVSTLTEVIERRLWEADRYRVRRTVT